MSLENYAKKRFMIVDELDSFRFATKKALMSLGIKLIDNATSAQQVVSAFQNVDYDVILCNFNLGKGKNGQELLEELRFKKLLKYTSLFFIVSAEVAKDKVMGTIENEPDGYFVKPIPPADLSKRLLKSLQQKEAMRAIDVALDQGDFAKAIQLCDDKIQQKDPYRILCFKVKSWALTQLGRLDEAKQLYSQILQISDYNWAEFGLAKLQLADGELDASEKLLKHIIDKDENRVEAYDLLAEIASKRKNHEEAKSLLNIAVKKSPNSLLRQKSLAEASLQSGSFDDGFEAFRKVIKLSDQSIYAEKSHFFSFADQLTKAAASHAKESTQNSMKKEAFELLQKARKRFSEADQIAEQVQLVEASLHTNLGDTEQAEKLLTEVNEKLSSKGNSLNPESSFLAAQSLFGLGRNTEAEKLLESAADKSPDNAELVGKIYDTLESRISLQKRQQAAESNKRGIALYNEGKITEAITALESVIPLTPRHISLNLNLLQVMLKQAKKEGIDAFKDACSQCLHRVRHIQPTHKEYRRYNHLKKQFQTLA